ncbi:HAD family phosphatase [soil metagenome]
MIDTIFFDWGGVLAADPGDNFLIQLLLDLGATQEQADEVYTAHMRRFMKGELTEADFWDELRTHYNLTINDSISEEFMKWNGLVVDQNVLQVARDAQAAGIKVAIFSNVIEPTYNALAKAGCYDGFDAVIASCKVGYAKPELDIYQLALRELNTAPERSLFIDDKQKNLDPAVELGFATVLAQNSEQIVSDIRSYLA